MKTKSIKITLVRKISDDKFGSFGAEITEEFDLEEGDKRKDCYPKAIAAVEKQLEEAVKAAGEIYYKNKAAKKSKD